jgi:hypothetical protein
LPVSASQFSHYRQNHCCEELEQPKSDEKGTFSISGLEPGSYWVITAKPSEGYPDTLAAIYGDERAPKVSLLASALCSNVTVNLGPKAARLHVLAVDATSRNPLSNLRAKIIKLSTGTWTSTAADRDVLIPAGAKVMVEITAEGYHSSKPIELDALQPDERKQITVVLSPDTTAPRPEPTARPVPSPITKPIKAAGCVNGKVVDENQTPVPAVKVTLMPVQPTPVSQVFRYVKTSDEGRFNLNNIGPGTYWIITSKREDGYPDTGARIYREDRAPVITVSTSASCIEETVSLGLKAARILITALDNRSHQKIQQSSVKIIKPSTGAWIGTEAGTEVFVPAFTELTVTVHTSGYRPADPVRVQGIAPNVLHSMTVMLNPE